MELTLHFFILLFLNFSMGLDFLQSMANHTDIRSSCPPFGIIDHGAVALRQNIVTEDISQQTVHIECMLGYELVGPPKISCINGKWEQTVRPHCVVLCNPPPNISNGEFQIEDDPNRDGMYRKGTLATYSCKKDFELRPPDSSYRVCEKGIWTGATAVCVPKGCKPPKDIENGYFVPEKAAEPDGFYEIGQRLHFSCKPGFVLFGARVQLCLEDGTWSPKLGPVCVSDATG